MLLFNSRYLLLFLLAVCSCLSPIAVASGTSLPAESRFINYLIFGEDNGPLQILSDDTTAQGFITDAVSDLLHELEVAPKAVVKPIKRMKRDILDGHYKPWITYGMRGWETLPEWEGVKFLPQDLFAYTLSQVTFGNRIAPIKLLQNADGLRFLLIRGFDYAQLEHMLKANGGLIVYAENFAQALRMLKHGRADIFLGFDKRVNYVLRKTGLVDEPFHINTFMGGRLSTQATLMVSDDVPQVWVEQLARQLQIMLDDGRWQTIWQRY